MATDNNLESYMGGVDDSNMNKNQATNDFHYIPAPLKVNVKPVDTGNGKTAGGKDYQEALKQYNDLAATNELPKFRISNGRVKLSGNAKYVNSDIVNSASTMLRDYFKGADLTNAQNAENLQKALDEVNEQIASQLRYQEYADFLDKTGFSDAAYRNYALARTEADPTTTTNLMNSTKKFSGYDKDGNLLTGNDAKTPAEWFTYWKENFTPEERLKLWIDSMDALSRAENDEDLYRGLPYILMGVKETENVPARIMNTVNPFDEEGWGAGDGNKAKERASVNVPIYGFEDVSQPDVFWDSFWSTNKEAFGRLIGFVGSQTDPLARFLGPKYVTGGANTPEEWGNTNGIEGVTYETIGNISKEDWDRFADIVNEFWGTKNPERLSGKSDAEILIEKYGKDDAAKIMLVRDFSTLPSTQGREEGYKAYQKYQEYAELQSSEGYKSPYEKWGREFESEMQQHLSRLGTLAPSSSTFGVISGTIARIMAEQAALSYISGGSLSAAKIAENLTRGGWKLVGKALDKIGVGQYVFSKAPALAKAVAGLANGSAEGLAGASKAIYVTGAIGTWAVREMGEDVLRGLVDDMVTANSFDSQGNLDPNKLIENIYMNALMYGMAKGVGGAFKGLAGIVDNAKTRNIDGVELNATQQRQLRLLQSALDDQNSRVIFRGFDDEGHPVVTNRGITHTLDELTASGDTMKQINDATGAAAPTTLRTVEDILADEEISETTREKIAEVARDKDLGTSKPGWEDDVKTKLQEKLTDDEIREAFPDGVIKIGDETVRISTKDFTAGDVGRVGGLDFKTIDDAIVALKQATTVRDFTNAVNGIMRTAKYFAENFKRAVEEFAQANNMSVRDVMIEIRNSRIAGHETIPGLKELWDTYWKPTQDALLDIQEARTGIRPVSHDFYFRDMIEGTFKPSDSGAWSIDNSTTADILRGDSTFDLTASSTAKNTGKLGELAADKLEYDPEVLAREFVASRLQTIWASDDMGKTFAAMQEAHDAGEFDFTEADAAKSIKATEQVAGDVENSAGVKEIQNLVNVEKLDEEFGMDDAAIKEVSDTPAEDVTAKQVEAAAEASKAQAVTAQKAFNDSASKSNAAELISKNSGYRNRATRVNPGPVVGVNYMPGDPFKRFSGWVNDHFVKANSIKTTFSGYKADGSPVSMSITAYNGGYKMFAEAGSFARNVIVDIQNGSTLWDAVYKQVYENGFFIEPSKSQRTKYGALTVREQAAKATDRIMDRMNKDARFSHAFADDGTVKDTAALISMLTTRFRGQGINDFSKFLRKANWDSFTKGEQKWLNKRMYEMTASSNAKTKKLTIDGIMRASMGLRYRSNMWFNFKNGQLQLTECQRLFTMNKVGDFGSTLKRLVTDRDYRQKVSDYTYILASESAGAGFSKSDLENAADAAIKLGSESTISRNGIMTDIDKVKAKFKDFDDTALASVEGGEYAKNYILIAGFVAAGEKQGLDGAQLDVYVRNRFNTEALAGTNVGKIGLTDSTIGQFAFMYLGFPIRDLTLQWHMLRGGGIRGDVRGSLEYLAKVLGAKGAVWAIEAPWGYSLMDQIGLDPFGLAEQYDQMPNDYQERDPFWRLVDEFGVRYNPFMQGAMTSAFADVYFSYRAAQEAAREEYKEAHNGSTEGFEWSLADAGGEMWTELVKGITPGYTAASRVSGELQDLDRGYHISQSGSRIYETNTDLGNVGWGLLTGRRNTANAQDYYQTANPIRGMIENGLPGLGQQFERAMPVRIDQLLAGKNPFRDFREFDPIDSETYEDWFDGSYQDQQNWNTGIYAFQEEAQEIGDRYDKYAQTGTAVNDMNARENELSDLRKRVELYVQAYTDKHPEGISAKKQNQIINIFNLGEYQPTLQESFQEAQGNIDMTDWEAAQNRYSRGNFPTAYGLTQNKNLENDYAQSPQLQDVLSRQRYGVNSEAAPMIDQMFNSQSFDTPLGNMTMKDYHDAVYAQLEDEWNKSKPDYEKITRLQEAYLDEVSKNVIQPILNTYGSSVLSAGRSSEIMQEFGKMLNGMIPSDQYRIDKKGRKIYQSTPYMTVDIPKWMRANFKAYEESVDKTDRQASRRLDDIRRNLDAGRTSTAKSYARALIQDIGSGKVSVSRDELEWLQGVLND